MRFPFLIRGIGICGILLAVFLFDSCGGSSRGVPDNYGIRSTRKDNSSTPRQSAKAPSENTSNTSNSGNSPSSAAIPTEAVTNGVPNIGYVQTGLSSYYSDTLHGKVTASGEIYDKNAMTASHKTLPFGTICDITNTAINKTITVRINDRCTHSERILDLSRAAAEKLDAIQAGIIPIELVVTGYENPGN